MFSAFIIIIIMIFTQTLSFSDGNAGKAIRYYAHRADWLKNFNCVLYQKQNKDIYLTDINSANAAILTDEVASNPENFEIQPAMAKAVLSLYPLYEKEYFYRNNVSEPIGDFRSYDVKAVMPDPEHYNIKKYTHPLRDFRFDYWENKYYR